MTQKRSLIAVTLFLFVTLAFGQFHKRADMLFEAKRYDLAAKEYATILDNNPKDTYSALKITQCYLNTGDLKLAKNYLLIVEENSKSFSLEYYSTKAELLQKQHEFDEAIEFYKKSDPHRANFRETSKRIKECEYGKKLIKKPLKVKIRNLGTHVNSPQHDYLPQITADFQLLYFTSQRQGFTGDKGHPEDIYYTTFTGAGWSSPSKLDPPINTEDNEACIGLSPDGQMMFIFKGTGGGDLYISKLKGKKWGKPEAFPYNTEDKEASMCISPDGNKLYFTRKVNGRNSNIYECSKTANDNWSKPRTVGVVNTEYDEESPFIHPDGKTMYFSSKGHNTIGGYDIFKSEWNGSSWGTPQNLGYPINTAGDELTFVLSASGQFGFYSSVRDGGEGGLDLYMITMPLEERNKNLALVKGKVEDAISGKALDATVIITDNDAGIEYGRFKTNEETGEYMISLPSGKNYGISIEKEGHLFHSENIYLDANSNYKTVKQDIQLVNTKPGSKIVLNNIFFETGSYKLKASSFPELARLTEILHKNPSLKIEISGHTDNTGNEATNKELSVKRAEAVKAYLVLKGISTYRIKTNGLGSSEPLAPNDTEANRQKNRRTELKIID